MLKIEPEGKLKETNFLRIKTIKASDRVEKLVTEFNVIFKGIGCFKQRDTARKMEVKLKMDPTATPVAQKSRNVPYLLQKPLKEWLDEGIENEIFEKEREG